MGKKYKKIRKNGFLVSDLLKSRCSMCEELVRAAERAETANKAKRDFLSRVSHEIRTPMNAVIGMTRLAINSDDINKIKDYLEKIDEASNHLREVINGILDFSETEANKFELNHEKFALQQIIENINNIIFDKMKAKNIIFNLNVDKNISGFFIGDESRLMQVIMHLLNNAVKFTLESGEITLSVKELTSGKGSALLEIRVSDTGIGMSKEQQTNLFKPFEQADGSISRKYSGMGVGLAICKKIVELMGGNIYAESELGKGSTFIFTVSLETEQSENHKHSVSEHEQSDNMINAAEITQELLLPDIDLNGALKKLSGNKKLFVSIMKSFRGKDLYNQIIDANAKSDLKAAINAAHALANLASHFSMPLLHLNAITLENHLKTAGFTEFYYYINRIESVLETIYEKIKLIIEINAR